MAKTFAASSDDIHRPSRVRRWLSIAYLSVLLSGLVACPIDCPWSDTSPSADLSVEFHLEPPGGLNIRAGETATYQVIVDRKGILNAGVEFELRNVPAGVTATVNPARISETARETQLVVQASPTVRSGEYDLDLRGRLTVAGRGAPNWHTTRSGTPVLRISGGVPAFDLACSESTFTLSGGTFQNLHCRTSRDAGFASPIELSINPKPAYLTISPEPGSLGPAVDSIVFRIERARLVETPAFVDLVLTARSGGVTRQHTVRVEMPSDRVVGFDVVCDAELTVRAGDARTLVCLTFRSAGFVDVINFSFAPHPAYLTIYDETARVGPDRQIVEFSVVRSLTAPTPAFFDLEVIARAFLLEERATVRVQMPGS